ASMLAVLFSVGGLARTNEILAMLTSGVHGLRLSVPILFGGIIIVVCTFIMNEYVVPPLERANTIYELQLEGDDIREFTMNANVCSRGRSEWFYMARVYSNEDKEMIRPSSVHLQPGHDTIKMRIEAESAQFQENNREEHTSIWLFEQPRIWEFDAQGQL